MIHKPLVGAGLQILPAVREGTEIPTTNLDISPLVETMILSPPVRRVRPGTREGYFKLVKFRTSGIRDTVRTRLTRMSNPIYSTLQYRSTYLRIPSIPDDTVVSISSISIGISISIIV